jgi:environmental stress-induced protein Ves
MKSKSGSSKKATGNFPRALFEHRLLCESTFIDMIERARYLPREAYTSMPWRNGTGVTREIAREPAQGESFAWRLSLATIGASGPFSSYPGYERAVALVDGRGFRLNNKDTRTQVLSTRGEHALFPGGAATACELLDGPCTDLSLMVRTPGRINAVARLRVGAELTVAAAAGTLHALFVLHGAIECRALESSLPGFAPAAHPQTLDFNDTLLIHGSADFWSLRQASNDTAELLIFEFTPNAP